MSHTLDIIKACKDKNKSLIQIASFISVYDSYPFLKYTFRPRSESCDLKSVWLGAGDYFFYYSAALFQGY